MHLSRPRVRRIRSNVIKRPCRLNGTCLLRCISTDRCCRGCCSPGVCWKRGARRCCPVARGSGGY
ncbi:hypothetical protein BDD12DRAFT_839738 [Trichophaea hybrida]|nr:hypothetical protein BDD12DRAFT_839738 [Trichophaea hybrida]